MLRFRLSTSIGWLVAALVAGAAATPGPTRAAAPNLLKNPGFEQPLAGHEWMPTAWDTSRAGLSSVFFGRDTLLAHGGSYSATVANASGLYPLANNWSQSLIVGREVWGKDLVLSVWTKSLGVEGRAYIKLEAYRDTIGKMAQIWKTTREQAATRLEIQLIDDPIFNLAWQRQFFVDAETEWVRREVRIFIPPSVNMVYVRCGLIGTGQLVVDDAALTAVAARPAPEPRLETNLLADPDFEGDLTAWEYSMPPYPGMKAERDTTTFHSGKGSLAMSSPPAGIVKAKTGISQVLANRALAGKHLKFTGYVKCDSLTTNAYLSVFCHTLRGSNQFVSIGDISGTMDWTKATVDVDVPPDTYEVWAWFNYTAPDPGRIFFDDASLIVTGKASAAKP